MTHEPKFGENFQPDATNRLDVLKKQKLPGYLDLSRECRSHLKESMEQEGWPKIPKNITSIEDFFGSAKQIVDEKWSKYVGNLLAENSKQWLQELPPDEENEKIRSILSEPKKLNELFVSRQLGILEDIRSALPEAWRSLVLLASEKQLAATAVLVHWINEISDQQTKKMGTSKEELKQFINFAGIMGKYFDHAYVKQIELADAPGGSVKSKLGNKQGAEYLYDVTNKEGGIDLKSYSDVFPTEWPRITKYFSLLGDKIESLENQKKLPPSYKNLPSYLRSLAATYGSKEVNPKKLYEMWSNLSQQCTNLIAEGCPVVLIPQGTAGVAGDANKVDAELRLGFRTKKDIEAEKGFVQLRNFAQHFLDNLQGPDKEHHEIPRVLLNHQPFAYGPNLYFFTPAEAGDQSISGHTNAIEEFASYTEQPLAEKILGKKLQTSEYQKMALHTTMAHELGHQVVSSEDEEILQRIGTGSQADILDELKAETVGAKQLYHATKEGILEIDLEKQLESYVGTISSYIAKNASETGSFGERYHFTGIAMISALLNEGALKKSGDHYKITSVEKAWQTLDKLADEVLSCYTDQNFGKKERNEYVKKIKALAKSEAVTQFKEKLEAN